MIQMNKKLLVVIVGPTGIGKTALSIKLAKKFNAEIISADSRQFYRETEIGTAKPDNEELAAAPHHLINTLSIHDNYSVGDFEKEATSIIDQLFSDNSMVIMVGGSGLYVDAVCYGMDEFPSIDPKHRKQLNELFKKEGIEPLQKELKLLDADYFRIVDQQNPQRLIRALEVIRATGQTFTSFRKRKKVDRPFNILKIGLEMDREKLYDRIDLRMDLMIDNGLFEEAEKLYPFKALNALQTVGYQEIFGYLAGSYDKAEAIRLLKRNSRRYAKRQMTWFKRDQNTHWYESNQTNEIISLVQSELESLVSED